MSAWHVMEKRSFPRCFNMGNYRAKNAEKCEKCTNTGPVPGLYLWNHGSDRHEINTIVERIDWAGELGVGWSSARGTCTASGTFVGNWTIFDVFHD